MDLISREAVCDIINDAIRCSPQEERLTLEGVGYAICRIPSAQRWIPVSERLPEYGESVLTYEYSGLIAVNVREQFDGKDVWEDAYGFWENDAFGDVLAWMPLPEPYKED